MDRPSQPSPFIQLLQNFIAPKSNATLTLIMLAGWLFGVLLRDVTLFPFKFVGELLTTMAITILMYLLVDGAMKLDDTRRLLGDAVDAGIAAANERAQARIGDAIRDSVPSIVNGHRAMLRDLCREKVGRVGSLLRKEHLQEIMLAGAFPPYLSQKVLDERDLNNYTKVVLDAYMDSLDKQQFYERVHIDGEFGLPESALLDESGKPRRFAHGTLIVSITVRRFGDGPPVLRVQHPPSIAKIEEIAVNRRPLTQGEDFIQKDVLSEKTGSVIGWEVEFVTDLWQADEKVDFRYRIDYDEFDHWTNFAWVAGNPIRHLEADFRLNDGLTLKDFNPVCNESDRIDIDEISGMRHRVFTTGWLMPGEGFVVIFSNTDSVRKGDFSKKTENSVSA